MIIFLYGPDSYRRVRKTGEIVASYEAKRSGLALARFDFSNEGEWGRFGDFVSSFSLFESVKLAVCRGVYEGERAAVLKFLKDKETVILISEEAAPPKNWAFLLKKADLVQEFPLLSGKELVAFLKKETQRRGMDFDRRTTDFLINRFGSDTWSVVTEMEKISLGAPLSESVAEEIPDAILDFVRAVSGGAPPKTKLPLLERAYLKGEPPPKVFNILAKWRISKEFKRALADCDVMAKSGKLEYDEILLGLACAAKDSRPQPAL